MEKVFISKKDTKALYGIAILLMIFHHCFCIPARLNNDYISILGAKWEIETKLAWVGKLCVAIYAFISGYGLSVISRKVVDLSWKNQFKRDFKRIKEQLCKFYSKFWLVFVIFVPIGCLFFERKYNLSYIVKGLLFGAYYCGEWWYVRQYLVLLILFPIVDFAISYIEKEKKYLIAIEMSLLIIGIAILRIKFWDSVVASVFLWCINTFGGTYICIFILACLIARYRVFEKLDEKFCLKSPMIILGVLGVMLVRYIIVRYASQSSCDIILGPVFIYFATCFLHSGMGRKVIIPVLEVLGKYSTYMWLTHTFWLYYYFQPIALMPKISVLIFLWVTLLSFVTAYILNQIYEIITKLVKRRDGVTSRAE